MRLLRQLDLVIYYNETFYHFSYTIQFQMLFRGYLFNYLNL